MPASTCPSAAECLCRRPVRIQPYGAHLYTKIKDWDSETRNYTHADPFPSVNVTYRINDGTACRFY